MAASILAQGTIESTSVVAFRASAPGATLTRVRCVNGDPTPQTVVMKLAAKGAQLEFGRAELAQHEAVDFPEGDLGLEDREAVVLQTTTAGAIVYHVHGAGQ